jgi:hypothetical protein
MKTLNPYKGKLTVGVLFPGNSRVYTYLIRRGHRVKLGDELVVDSPFGGPKTVFVVRIDKKPFPFDPGISYKEVTRKVVPI